MNGLPMPNDLKINDGHRFKCLKIEGTPKNKAGFFSVNFYRRTYDGDNDDIAVSCEFCFNHKGYTNEIVCYTYDNGIKNSQVFSGTFPFKTQTSFGMEISTKNCIRALKVFVNEAKILEYLISIDISSFVKVRVDGDLDLSHSELQVD